MFKTATFGKCSTCTVKHFSSLSSIIPLYLKLEKEHTSISTNPCFS